MKKREARNARLLALSKEGKTYRQIAEILNSEGFKTIQGKPLDIKTVTRLLHYLRKKDKGQRGKRSALHQPIAASQKAKATKVMDLKTAILSSLTLEEKLKILNQLD